MSTLHASWFSAAVSLHHPRQTRHPHLGHGNRQFSFTCSRVLIKKKNVRPRLDLSVGPRVWSGARGKRLILLLRHLCGVSCRWEGEEAALCELFTVTLLFSLFMYSRVHYLPPLLCVHPSPSSRTRHFPPSVVSGKELGYIFYSLFLFGGFWVWPVNRCLGKSGGR